MPVLRSREIVPILKPKTPGKALDTGTFEPDTPAKSGEGLNEQLNVSPLTPDTANAGLGSGLVRRRSARLASKSNLGSTDVVEDVQSSSRKRMKLDSGVNGTITDGFDLHTPASDDPYVENGHLHLEAKEARVTNGVVQETGILEDMNHVVGTGVGGTRLEANDCDLRTRLSDERVESMRKGQRKTRSGMGNMLQLEDAGQDGSEKRFLNLRSGKRIAKIGVREEDGDKYYEAESNFHCELDCYKQNGSVPEDGVVNIGTRNRSEADAKEAENDTSTSGMKFNREEKGKMKVNNEKSLTRSLGSVEVEFGVKEVAGNKAAVGNEMHVEGRSSRRIDKGKDKLIENDISSRSNSILELKSEIRVKLENSSDSTAAQDSDHSIEALSSPYTENKIDYLERFRDIAKRNAARFAHFSSQVEEEEADDVADAPGREISPETDGEKEDWPGPFSTAMKIIRDRQLNASVQHHNSSDKSKAASVLWIPKRDEKCNLQKKSVPSLQDLCLYILMKNADAITSLECVPDVLRHKLSHLLCDSRRMNSRFLELLVDGSPTEIHLKDCSWLTEEDFTRAFERCDVSNLTVLQLDQCGRCLPDYILTTTLARSPNSLPALGSLSLRGAYRFSDVGLNVLISSTTALRSINLSQCSLLTSDGICCLATSLGSVLRELYLDDCQGIDAMLILPALLQIDNLQVLSLSGIDSVSDGFIREFASMRGHNMKEFILENCTKLTDSSVRVIAEKCPKLCAIDLSNLCKLTDASIGYLANGCRAIQNLKLCRNTFSDEAVAAYLETCGEFLKELSLNNVIMVAHNTAISLAKHSRNLNSLDLSWCRSLTDEALGLIVDSCSSLKVLKVFGCTQITNVFLSGHSNPEVQIIGLKMKPILEHLNSHFLQGPLRY